MAEKLENMEVTEQVTTPEVRDQLRTMYMESALEAELSGNNDMAEYYREKIEKLDEVQQPSDGARLGGWYAGYTPGEWRRMANEEYAKNGNSIEYRKCIQNAQKAEG